jgi:hypothetical protein
MHALVNRSPDALRHLARLTGALTSRAERAARCSVATFARTWVSGHVATFARPWVSRLVATFARTWVYRLVATFARTWVSGFVATFARTWVSGHVATFARPSVSRFAATFARTWGRSEPPSISGETGYAPHHVACCCVS